jgi:hypothetical protein
MDRICALGAATISCPTKSDLLRHHADGAVPKTVCDHCSSMRTRMYGVLKLDHLGDKPELTPGGNLVPPAERSGRAAHEVWILFSPDSEGSAGFDYAAPCATSLTRADLRGGFLAMVCSPVVSAAPDGCSLKSILRW